MISIYEQLLHPRRLCIGIASNEMEKEKNLIGAKRFPLQTVDLSIYASTTSLYFDSSGVLHLDENTTMLHR